MKASETLVAEPPPGHDAVRGSVDETHGRGARLLERYRKVRNFSARLCRGLQPEDYVVQSMPDVSPTKWHLAHTSWFFETFVVKVWMPRYRSEVPQYAYLFNSYYNAAGDMHRRDLRGLISRPTVAETYRFRESIDECLTKLLSEASEDQLSEIEHVLTLGLHHEQQHQELLLTDIKHVFAQNPLYPVFQEPGAAVGDANRVDGPGSSIPATAQHFIEFDEATVFVGHDGAGFSYDNEGPRHRALVLPFSLSNRLVTNGEYLAFIEAGGYTRPEFWLSLGWTTANEQRWEAPLYWIKRDNEWWNFTLSGLRRVDESEPVTHISYFEADAYANWTGARLPTEFEWERAATNLPITGNFVDDERFHPAPARPNSAPGELQQMFGDVWEWTRSAYLPYPGYRAGPGALGEYNGKFMSNQMVLRGGSCATSQNHMRVTYRNFFQPEKRWQFNGIRLARDPS
ncbi:MAG TPA: ergothioneine biosynthesis protein EgtB [Chthoniobacterales bacterium]|nr:ergothioneine biosynthesis protein EgtB [Chthoniobacterales bacterium]